MFTFILWYATLPNYFYHFLTQHATIKCELQNVTHYFFSPFEFLKGESPSIQYLSKRAK